MFLFKLTTLQIKALMKQDEIIIGGNMHVPKHLNNLAARYLYAKSPNLYVPGCTFTITERGKRIRELLQELQDQEILLV